MAQENKKNIKIIRQKIGLEQRQSFLDEIEYKGSYLPNSIYYEDIDKTFIDFIDDVLEVYINGEKVPVYFLTIQRWVEFSKTWTNSNKFKDFKMPFITIVREPAIQVGQNQSGMWNIPGNKLYTYMKVPTFENGVTGMDTYKIPQPTSVDVTYDVRLFCNRMRDLNKFNRKVQLAFQSRQYYVSVNGHPMPIHLESIGDESQIQDFNKRRYYVQNFNMKLLGYILDENDYEHIPTVNRALIFTEIIETTLTPKVMIKSGKKVDEISLTVIVREDHFGNEFTINCEYDITITDIDIIENVNNVNLAINGVQQTVPFDVNSNETITLVIDRDETKDAKLVLKGKLR